MTWSFSTLFLTNLIVIFCSTIIEYVFIKKISNEKPQRQYAWLIYFFLSAAFSLLATMLTYQSIVNQGYWNYNLLMIILEVGTAAVSVIVHHYIFSGILRRILTFICVLAGISFNFTRYFLEFILYNLSWDQYLQGFSPLTITAGKTFFELTFIILSIRFLSKTKGFQILHEVFQYPNFASLVALTSMLLQYVFLNALQLTDIEEPKLIFFASICAYTVFLIFYFFLLYEYLRERQLRNSKLLLKQQAVYLERLEGIQQELRKIHHDYKNVATGLYAQIEAGDLSAAQEYISKQLLQVDQNIQVSIQQMNQLTNLQVIELKALLMTKIMLAEKQKVLLNIEIIQPINRISLGVADLLRCSGILLDNAIEEAAITKEKKVTIILYKEKDTLTFVVQNSIERQIDLQRIWEIGYSTKGEQRGLGLATLKDITKRYPNIWLETRIEENFFIQVLTIFNK